MGAQRSIRGRTDQLRLQKLAAQLIELTRDLTSNMTLLDWPSAPSGARNLLRLATARGSVAWLYDGAAAVTILVLGWRGGARGFAERNRFRL